MLIILFALIYHIIQYLAAKETFDYLFTILMLLILSFICILLYEIYLICYYFNNAYIKVNHKFRGPFGEGGKKKFTYPYLVHHTYYNKPTCFVLSIIHLFMFELYTIITGAWDMIYWITHVGRKE